MVVLPRSYAAVCIASLTVLSGCHVAARREMRAQAHKPLEVLEGLPRDTRRDEDVVAYAAQCKEELGITQPLPDMSCLAGVEVPITVNGQEVGDKELRALAAGRGGCDRAQWLDGQCWTYDLVQRVEIQDDVEAVLNCRQKLFTNPLAPHERMAQYERAVATNAPLDERLRLFRQIFEFDDLGFILRNRRSGKSCFFTFFGKLNFDKPGRSYAYYGGWIPAPDREQIASRDDIYRRLPDPKPPEGYPDGMWHRGPRGTYSGKANMYFPPKATAAGGCVSCHAHGAFKHSPFIDQAFADGRRIVPSNARDVPYLPVGRVFQESFRKTKIVEIATEPILGATRTCTTCHRLTKGGRGAVRRQAWATGMDVPKASATARGFPFRAWMPLDHGIESRTAYHDALGPMIKAIECCEKTPNAIGCRSRPIGPTAADVKLDARGRLSADGWVLGSDTSIPACVPQPAATTAGKRAEDRRD